MRVMEYVHILHTRRTKYFNEKIKTALDPVIIKSKVF